MSAIRLARGIYQARSDPEIRGLLPRPLRIVFSREAGSGLATLGISACPGVPEALARAHLERALQRSGRRSKALFAARREDRGDDRGTGGREHGSCGAGGGISGRACAILRSANGALLIVDEVITGFRIAYGGAQNAFYGIRSRLSRIGKIIGGGLPVAAYGGAATSWNCWRRSGRSIRPARFREILWRCARDWRRYQNLSRRVLRRRESQDAPAGRRIARGAEGNRHSRRSFVAGSLLTLFFCEQPVRNYDDAKKSDTARFGEFFQAMLERGIFLPPSQFEALFVSAAHTDADIDRTIAAARESLATV